MLTDSQKIFVYENYLKISVNEISKKIGVKINHINRFISSHSVGEMIDKFDSLKKEGISIGMVSQFEAWQIQKNLEKDEADFFYQKEGFSISRIKGKVVITIQSKLNYEKGNGI